jgi:hypothetical protein
MAVLGLILAVAAGVYVAAAFFTTSDQATLSVLGVRTTMSVGHFVALGVLAGLVFAIGLMMLFGGIGRAARRRRETRQVVVSSRTEAEELRAENERLARELEERQARSAAADTVGDSTAVDSGPSRSGQEPAGYVARHGNDQAVYPDEPALRSDVASGVPSTEARELR